MKITTNKSQRTFTIRKNYNGIISKFRTLPVSKEEFKNMDNYTENDWQDFLNTQQSYYPI